MQGSGSDPGVTRLAIRDVFTNIEKVSWHLYLVSLNFQWLWWPIWVDWFTEISGSRFLITIFYMGSKDLWCVAIAVLQVACVLTLFVWLLLFIILSIRIANGFEYAIFSVGRKYNASIYIRELNCTFLFLYSIMYSDIVIRSNDGCRLKIGNFSSECHTWRSTMKRSTIYWHQRIGSYKYMRALRYCWGTGPAPSISRVPKLLILQMCVSDAFWLFTNSIPTISSISSLNTYLVQFVTYSRISIFILIT